MSFIVHVKFCPALYRSFITLWKICFPSFLSLFILSFIFLQSHTHRLTYQETIKRGACHCLTHVVCVCLHTICPTCVSLNTELILSSSSSCSSSSSSSSSLAFRPASFPLHWFFFVLSESHLTFHADPNFLHPAYQPTIKVRAFHSPSVSQAVRTVL